MRQWLSFGHVNPLDLTHNCRGHLKVDIEKELELVKLNSMGRQHQSPAYKAKHVSPLNPLIANPVRNRTWLILKIGVGAQFLVVLMLQL